MIAAKHLVRAALLGSALALTSCGTLVREARFRTTGVTIPGPTDAGRAAAAWQYFRDQRDPARGLVMAADGAGFTTPAAIGDDLAAAFAAYRLGVIDRAEYDGHIAADLTFLQQIPLADGALPGRFYATGSGALVDFPTARDPGWSAVEIGRLLVWLRLVAATEPARAAGIEAIVGRWQLCRARDGQGQLLTALPDNRGGFTIVPDTRRGQVDYAVEGYRAWGLAIAEQPATDFAVKVHGVSLPIRPAGADHGPLVTSPYALLGIEFGWTQPDGQPLPVAAATFRKLVDVQRRRTEAEHVPTARDDYRQAEAPFVVVSSVLAGSLPWSTIDGVGAPHPELALTSTKASFAMWALAPQSYTAALVTGAGEGNSRRGGWQEGVRENGGKPVATRTSATNAVVLESLLYRRTGRLAPAAMKIRPDACARP